MAFVLEVFSKILHYQLLNYKLFPYLCPPKKVL